MNGGYDDGQHSACPCFWGIEVSSFVKLLAERIPSLSGMKILDAGCGEGKNAVFFAGQGASVDAIDVSEIAIRNGLRRWPDVTGIQWRIGDIRQIEFPRENYDVVICCIRLAPLPSI